MFGWNVEDESFGDAAVKQAFPRLIDWLMSVCRRLRRSSDRSIDRSSDFWCIFTDFRRYFSTESMEVDDVPREKTIRDGNSENMNGNTVPETLPSPAKKTRQYVVNPNTLAVPREGLEIER